jgi:hypothetical protein
MAGVPGIGDGIGVMPLGGDLLTGRPRGATEIGEQPRSPSGVAGRNVSQREFEPGHRCLPCELAGRMLGSGCGPLSHLGVGGVTGCRGAVVGDLGGARRERSADGVDDGPRHPPVQVGAAGGREVVEHRGPHEIVLAMPSTLAELTMASERVLTY